MIENKNHLKTHLTKLQLSENLIEKVLELFKLKSYRRKTFFAYAGGTSDKIGFIIEGLFYMYINKDNGTIFTKDFIQPNNFLLATFDPNLESSINLQAITDSIVAEAKYSEIQQFCLEDPDFELLCRKGIENRINEIYQRIESFATTDAKERYLQFKNEYGEIEPLIPQHIIASYLGITPTQLSRIRKFINICK